MPHKKKRTHTTSAPPAILKSSGPQRKPNRLDYSDESADIDPILDPRGYGRAIQDHLINFQESTADNYQRMDGSDEAYEDHQSRSRSPAMPSLNPASKGSSRKGSRKAASNGTVENRDRKHIWDTTSYEDKERIKEFWLNLGEDERKSLVKVEKEAIVKKVKEMQRHSCTCAVCGKRRHAIEEELESMYDAYYEELEQYANSQQFPSQRARTSSRRHLPESPRASRITEVLQSDDSDGSLDDAQLSLDESLTDNDSGHDEEDFSEEDFSEDDLRSGFVKFGNSLTVQGGILTVANDMLKNDGKEFISLMEQLAERRMQREQRALDDLDEYEDEFDDEDSEDYGDEDDDEQEAAASEQRTTDGKKMFQIFAANMFEQRVLTAYREKVAQERQAQLLQELELEDSREKEREAKKLKEKEKKKDKKRQQQLKKEEEKAKKEAERLAEEAAIKAEEERRAAETRKRKEEQRLKKEAEKKAVDAERFRKEEEKRKRLAEEKAREAKKQELAAKEKRAKEEAQHKEREAKEAAQKEAKLRKEAVARALAETAARADSIKTLPQPVQESAPTNAAFASRKLSPMPKSASPALGTTPVIPKVTSAKNLPPPRLYQDSSASNAGPRSIPGATQLQHRTMTPSVISPQQQQQSFSSHQTTFPRAALGHPPSMPVPLPPPGIGGNSMLAPPSGTHDPFAFSSQVTQKAPLSARTNGHSAAQIPSMQGPPGVFSTAPGLNNPMSPTSRMSTPQTSRLPPFNAFSGLGPSAGPREELLMENDPAHNRRSNTFTDVGAIGSISRPSTTSRTASSMLPAPIQRPTSIAPPRQSGFEAVMGSRALLDDDEPVVNDRFLPSWTSPPLKSEWTGSAALNDAIDEPYHPPPIGSSDRWGAAGAIGVKSIGQNGHTPKSKWGY